MDKRLKEYIKSGGTLGSLAKLPKGRAASAPFPCDPAKVYAKQVDGLALRLKRIGVKDVVIGVSGGLDSALVLLVAVGAFKKLSLPLSGIHAYTMPGFGTSKRTKTNADLLCEGLGVKMETISIAKSVRQHLKDIGHDGKTPDAAYENSQARMRTLILMDKANMVGGRLVHLQRRPHVDVRRQLRRSEDNRPQGLQVVGGEEGNGEWGMGNVSPERSESPKAMP